MDDAALDLWHLLVLDLEAEVGDAEGMALLMGWLVLDRAEESANGWAEEIVVEIGRVLEAREVAHRHTDQHRSQAADRAVPQVAYLQI